AAAEGALRLRASRRLGCWPLRKVRPGHGASLHYAGAFPIASEERELTCDRDSRLRGTRAVYLADGSIFPWIPPKGLTFNLMANADRVGALLARHLACPAPSRSPARPGRSAATCARTSSRGVARSAPSCANPTRSACPE